MRHYLGQKSLVIILIGAMVLLFGVGVCVYRARANTLVRLRGDLNEKKTELAGAQARIAKRGQLEQEYAGLREQLGVLEPSLPTYAYVPTFLKQIEVLAAKTDNAVAGVRPQPKVGPAPAAPARTAGKGEAGTKAKGAAPGPGAKAGASGPGPQTARSVDEAYERLPIELNLSGGYWDTAEFLGDLATFPKMIAVNDMQFTPTSGAARLTRGAPDLHVKVNLLALIYKGGEEESWTSDGKNSPS